MSQIALDDRIDELGDLIRQHYGLSDLGDPSASTDVGTLGAISAVFYRAFLGSNCCRRSYYS